MVTRKYTTHIVLILLLWSLFVPMEGWAQLQVQAERNAIGINESLRVKIILEDGDPDSLDLTPLERDFEIVGRARGSQVNIINGSMSKINTWSLNLVPRRSGALTLPRVCAASSCSEPVSIKVSDAPVTPDDAKVILEHGSLPQRVYVGQQILYPVRLFFRTPLQQASLSTPDPQGVDAEVIKLGEDKQRETYRDGWRFNVIERVYAIIPAQNGTLQIPSVTMEAHIQDSAGQRGRPGGLFDPFGSRGQLLRRRSAPAQIDVEPPASTEHPWLPAQELKLRDSWKENPPQLRVGEPATRTISIEAQGTSAEYLRAINLEVPSVFKIYPDKPERNNLQDGANGINAQLRQSTAIVPREAGTFTLPGITLHWWNLRAQRWDSAYIEPMEVKVLPAQRTGQEQPPATHPPAVSGNGNSNAPAGVESAPDTSKDEAEGESLSSAMPNAVTPPPQSSGRDYLWMGIAALCALGWLTTLLLWGRLRAWVKRQQASELHADPTPRGANERSSIERDLLKAAQQHDARGERHLLQQWAAAQYPSSPTPLDTLYHAGGVQIQEAMQQLNAALYSDGAHNWDGESLAGAVRSAWHKPERDMSSMRRGNGADLPPLYPEL